ncbi:MAG: sugar ABC transporter substrate-binding protein [Spirochaetales bacterium]|nr:sugar ABC transporter substrate-binding protein [Spirochaetales bacterium]
MGRLVPVLVLGAALAGALLFNYRLADESRSALTATILRNPASVKTARYHLAAIVPDAADPFFVSLVQGLRQEAQRRDVALQLIRYSSHGNEKGEGGTLSGDAERWFSIALKGRPDGMLLYVPQGIDVGKVLGDARERAVPVVLLSPDAAPQGAQRAVIGDSYNQGKDAASIVLGLLGSAARIGVMLPSSPFSAMQPYEEPFYKGILAALAAKPGAMVVAAVREEASILGGEQACASMLDSHPDINAVLCADSRGTIGASQVIVDRGQVGRIVIIGADANAEVIRLVEKGVVHATIVRDAAAMGEKAIDAILELKSGTAGPAVVKVGHNIQPAREALR